MSTSEATPPRQVENGGNQRNVPAWLYRLLSKTFFDKCPCHEESQRNDVNRYCITCDATICKYCVAAGQHDHHEPLTIYRHVYQDVVPLDQMQNYINCARIQPYKCNKKWVVSLTPLPHNGSGSLIEGDGACSVCRRKLTEPGRFHFCSIACKLEAYTGRKTPIPRRGGAGNNWQRDQEVHSKHRASKSYRRRRRKGLPHRAPLK